MNFTRLVLMSSGIFLLAIGLPSLLAPHFMAAGFGFGTLGGTGLVEISGALGGLHVALGSYFLIAAWNQSMMKQAMTLAVLVASGYFGGHVYGAYRDGTTSPLLWLMMFVEFLWVLMATNGRYFGTMRS